ncbi:MAG: Alcohol dehydrogenase GroES domain protein [Acidimicrobiaceae bacterium]|jgi:NADPH:quinone reductase-like Zn-dependent oxidoreductase|nr:Alcohol dehydrogenase GroES domain protein [Acidimicrobiaceae bacterium]
MPKAVRFDHYGGVDVLQVVEVARPVPGPGQVLVQVKAAGINPGEETIRKGKMHDTWPATFPSGEGSDLAGVIDELGEGVSGWEIGDEVLGFTNDRASHAELVAVGVNQLVRRPAGVSWEAGGALFVAGTTAYAGVRAVGLAPGDTVVVSGAAGGVGSIAVQLAKIAGATVIGLASAANHEWLAAHGVLPVAHGEGVGDRITDSSAGNVDAFVDTFGDGYVRLAVELGVQPARIDTIIDFAAANEFGVKTDGTAAAASAAVLAELADLIDHGLLEIPIAKVFPLAEVRDAYRELAKRHTRGKIVLVP